MIQTKKSTESYRPLVTSSGELQTPPSRVTFDKAEGRKSRHVSKYSKERDKKR
jgi:hypothetical protein